MRNLLENNFLTRICCGLEVRNCFLRRGHKSSKHKNQKRFRKVVQIKNESLSSEKSNKLQASADRVFIKALQFCVFDTQKNISADLWAFTSIFHNSRSSDYRERSSRVWSSSAEKIREVIINGIGGMQMQASEVSIHPEKIRRLPRRQDAVKCIKEKYDSITQRDTAARKKLFRVGQCSESRCGAPPRDISSACSFVLLLRGPAWFLRKAIILRRSKAKKATKNVDGRCSS